MSELSVGTLSGLAANSYVVDVAAGSTLDLSNATDLPASALPAGSILQVVSATKTDTFSASLASGASTAVTDLTINHAAADSANRVLLMGNVVGLGASSFQLGVTVSADGTPILRGDVSGSLPRVTSNNSSISEEYPTTVSFTAEFSPGSTSSVAYTVEVFNVQNATQTVYVNRGAAATTRAPVGASSLILMEVAG